MYWGPVIEVEKGGYTRGFFSGGFCAGSGPVPRLHSAQVLFTPHPSHPSIYLFVRPIFI